MMIRHLFNWLVLVLTCSQHVGICCMGVGPPHLLKPERSIRGRESSVGADADLELGRMQGTLRLAGGFQAGRYRGKGGNKRQAGRQSWWSTRLSQDGEAMLMSSEDAEEGATVENSDSDSGSITDVGVLGERMVRKKRKRQRRREEIQWLADTPDAVNVSVLVDTLRREFRLESFRGGQLEAVKRVVSGQSSLLVAATGSGKSLAYLLPAALLPGVAIVVSPLLALIKDQLMQLPGGVRGATLSSQMSVAQQEEVIEELKAGSVRILFVAPERLFTDAFQELAASLPVSFAAVDEAHCVSSWAPHFRPAYLRLRRVLSERIGVKCIIGLTATATLAMQLDLQRVLRIPPEGVIRAHTFRPNLHLSVVREARSVEGLIRLIAALSERMERGAGAEAGGIIVYCSFQRACDDLALALSNANILAKRYHAGCGDEERRRTQDLFLGNHISVVVATVAFGLGVNKPDVRAVIHYNCPSSVEEYVQQVGRAGRDGKPAYGILFLQAPDFVRLRSLAHSHAVEEESVTGLVRAVLVGGGRHSKWNRRSQQAKREGKKGVNGSLWLEERGPWESVLTIPDELCRRLDLYPETVETILSFMDEEGVLTVLPKGPSSLTVTVPSSGLDDVEHAGLLQAVVRLGRRVGSHQPRLPSTPQEAQRTCMSHEPGDLGGRYVVEVQKVCRSVGLSYLQLTRRLKQIDQVQSNGVTVETGGRSWRVQLHKDFRGDIGELGRSLTARLHRIQRAQVQHVDDLFEMLQSASEVRIPGPSPQPHTLAGASRRAQERLFGAAGGEQHEEEEEEEEEEARMEGESQQQSEEQDEGQGEMEKEGKGTGGGRCGLQRAIEAYFHRAAPPIDEAGGMGEEWREGPEEELATETTAANTARVSELLRRVPAYMTPPSDLPRALAALREDVLDLLQEAWGEGKRKLSALAIARLLHALPSPAFPASWAAHHAPSFWGLHASMDWRAVLAVASHVLAAPQVKEALRLSRAPTSKGSTERDARLMAWFEAHDASSSAPKPMQAVLAMEEEDQAALDAHAHAPRPRLSPPDGYRGEERRGLRWGVGVQEWKSGARYEGSFQRDACEGYGAFCFPDNALYHGQVEGGQPEGWGELQEGLRVYRGAFANGLPHGIGITHDAFEGRIIGHGFLVKHREGKPVRARALGRATELLLQQQRRGGSAERGAAEAEQAREEAEQEAAWLRDAGEAVRKAHECAARAREAAGG